MKPIGGYPELELSKGEHYHRDALKLNTARNCLEYILLARGYKKVYVPYYTCEAVLEPFERIRRNKSEVAAIEYYHIDKDFKPVSLPNLDDGEAFLYTNYFGLMQECIEILVHKYGDRLIVDNSQAFFDLPYPNIDTFYSARKFFGVSDGAYLYTGKVLEQCYGEEIGTDHSFDRMKALLKRIDLGPEAGYNDFQMIENSLSFEPIKTMSQLTCSILCAVDYDKVREIRRSNYLALHENLSKKQKVAFKLNTTAVPLCYPFLSESPGLRKALLANRIYVPTYWPNVLQQCPETSIEHQYGSQLLPLPIDQRYDHTDMKLIINNIINNL